MAQEIYTSEDVRLAERIAALTEDDRAKITYLACSLAAPEDRVHTSYPLPAGS